MRGVSQYGNRRILCVFPRYTSSFGTFEYAYPLTDGVQAFMPPQGLLLIAAYLRADWKVRFIDENIRAATNEDFEWAEAVFVSGMHIQRQQMNDICRRAHALQSAVAIGGPSVSACPGLLSIFDYLHVGELGDATDELIARLARDPSRPGESGRAENRRPSGHDQISDPRLRTGRHQAVTSWAASSIPAAARISASSATSPASMAATRGSRRREQITRELDKLLECGISGLCLFRRRQLHRQPQGRARSSAASDRMAEEDRLRAALLLRGDAEHRQAPGDPGADARGILRHDLLRHRDAGSRSRCRRCTRITT